MDSSKFSHLKNVVSVEELESYGDGALGLKIVAICGKEAVVGVIYHIFNKQRRILLTKAYYLNSQIPFGTFAAILYDDIECISVVRHDSDVRKKLLKKRVDDVKKAKLLQASHQWAKPDDEDEYEEYIDEAKCFGNLPTPYGSTKRPENDVIFYTMDDENIEEAIAELDKEEILCIVARGKDLGRAGTLSWLSISTSKTIYHFDVLTIEPKKLLGVDSELRRILTNKFKVKVLCDSRFFQDYLFHKHKFQLANVFDILYMDWVIGNLNSTPDERPPINVNDLSEIFCTFVGVPKEHALHSAISVPDDSRWLERPLHTNLFICAKGSVKFLREIRHNMQDNIFRTIQGEINNFSESVKCLDANSASIVEPLLVPPYLRESWYKKKNH